MVWYRRAAEEGYALAQYSLGFMHANGRGVSQVRGRGGSVVSSRGRPGLRTGAEKPRGDVRLGPRCPAGRCGGGPVVSPRGRPGSWGAQFTLGFKYATGLGVPQDDAEAVTWFRRAAEQPYVRAQSNLGSTEANDGGLPHGNAEAVRLHRMVESCHVQAQFNLGFMLANGRGIPQDDAEAVRWYRLAADRGYAFAQGRLGLMYADGRGVPQDDEEAHRWFTLAAAQSSSDDRDADVKPLAARGESP